MPRPVAVGSPCTVKPFLLITVPSPQADRWDPDTVYCAVSPSHIESRSRERDRIAVLGAPTACPGQASPQALPPLPAITVPKATGSPSCQGMRPARSWAHKLKDAAKEVTFIALTPTNHCVPRTRSLGLPKPCERLTWTTRALPPDSFRVTQRTQVRRHRSVSYHKVTHAQSKGATRAFPEARGRLW